MATRKLEDGDSSLPFAALQLLTPPVRLVSAALWKVMKQRDVLQYGVVEEFVTSACETVPGLLTARHQGKLALGLRGRYILELCATQPDDTVIKAHLERIRSPAALSLSSASTVKRDVKIFKTVESFHSLVHTLLRDPAEREQFFREEFPVDYGPEFDQELEKLLWEFLIRLDQLLPVPNLAQTVSWLTNAPPVLEECARAATQPQLLKILLHHQTCLGHLETAASLPPNMGDSILDSLSLPPSGRVLSKQITSTTMSPSGTQTQDKAPFITPVFGLISNKDVPIMISAKKWTQRGDELPCSKDPLNKNSVFTGIKQREAAEDEEKETSNRNRMKRKLPDGTESGSDEEEEAFRVTRSGRKRTSGSLGTGGRINEKKAKESGETEDQGVKTQPEDESIYISSVYPKVVIELLPHGAYMSSIGEKSTNVKERSERRKSPVKAPTSKNASSHREKPDSDCPGLTDKENHPVGSVSSSSQQRSSTGTTAVTGDADDYVADSEDEATKNFKIRLFTKRYFKTKHGTYVPTLREFRKPAMAPRRLSLVPSKRR